MKTERLFDQDAYRTDFDARVVSCEPVAERAWEIVLDRTGFCPEGGGQWSDAGTLEPEGAPAGASKPFVIHAEDRDGVIVHRTDAPIPAGTRVHGEILWDRRFDMMQQHTGEHILSGLICRNFHCDNVGFHIGRDVVTLDFNRGLSDTDVQGMENAANQVIRQNVPVEIRLYRPEELEGLQYRSKKPIPGDVRIVNIPGADTCACCGTHVAATGQVGILTVVSRMNYKGGVRIAIRCGERARTWLVTVRDDYQGACRLLSIQEALCTEVERLLGERDALKAQTALLASRLFDQTAAAERDKPVRVAVAEDMTGAGLTHAAGRLGAGAVYALALLPRPEGGWQFALTGAADVRPAAKALCERFGGKGGGRPEMAQGMLLSGEPEAFRALLEGLVP